MKTFPKSLFIFQHLQKMWPIAKLPRPFIEVFRDSNDEIVLIQPKKMDVLLRGLFMW